MKCPECQTDNPTDSRFCKSCGSRIQSINGERLSFTKTIQTTSKDFTTGTIFAERYKILGELGKGGMGIVYKAEDTKLRRTVALKFLPPELTRDQEAKERFIREAQAAASLDHPNICTVYEVDEFEDQAYISMAYIEGFSLRARLKKGPLSTKDALNIAIQIGEGLQEAHKKGIVHRDIKSANIMVDERGQARIMDFGLAKVIGGSLITKGPTTMGTVAYMSPEQTRGEAVDHRTDIWSFGVVLYEMLSGQLPFQGERETSIMYSIVHEKPAALKKINPDIPADLERIISRALEKKPESRYSSIQEILKDLIIYKSAFMKTIGRPSRQKKVYQILRKPHIAIPVIIAITVIGYFGFRSYSHSAKIRWARNEAIPQIEKLIDDTFNTPQWGKKRISAYSLALEAERYIPDDPKLIELWPKISRKVTIETTPPGANVYFKEYSSLQTEWEYLGVTPLNEIRLPSVYFRWKFEKEGYETVHAVAAISYKISRTLDTLGNIPPGMIRVKGREISEEIGTLDDFFIDRYEVTNKQFKEFVDSGAYQKKEHWQHKFMKEGKELSWGEAVSQFVDSTGRPGPSTWQAGDYPEGQDEFPVSGVSWYEVAAYADFRGKNLPSMYHWKVAAGFYESDFMYIPSQLIPLSNFDGKQPAHVGRYNAMTSFGALDMTGNVREWCWNDAMMGKVICGGAWNDINYMYGQSQQPPFDRSPRNGFRCVVYLEESEIPDTVFDPLKSAVIRDYYKEKPVSDDVFQAYLDQFRYDKAVLNPVVESIDESSADRIKEKITFDAAYGDERLTAYLFRPKNAVLPYQTVIVFPGTNVIDQKNSENLDSSWFDFFIKDGRAVMYPIYKGTFERNDGLTDDIITPTESTQYAYADYVVKWVKDFKRSIDYLETRSDIDNDKLAYYGISWGGDMGNIILAVESRVRTGILRLGGIFWDGIFRPEVDEINYVSRVKVPVLMLNGRYDSVFPYETTVKPMFDLLGTPEKDKCLKLYNTDHFIPNNELIKESLSWLDKYFGPVKRK
jgi:serine/threonine protein kinase/cephalosporin-C deacetylase-like acetyl esterase